jgi:cytochrome c556
MKYLIRIIGAVLASTAFTVIAADNDLTKRLAIEVTPAEYNHVLSDMQKMLVNLSQIQSALARSDWAMVEKIAYAQRPDNTMSSSDAASVSFHAKIPSEWRGFGRPMHQGWLALSENAKTTQNKDMALEQLARIGQSCAGCHATFQLKLDSSWPTPKAAPSGKSPNANQHVH